MPKPAERSLPSDAELQILRLLWTNGPMTVHEVHESLESNDTGYTTTLKVLQRMLVKGLVMRNTQQRQHVYAAGIPESATLGALVNRLVDRAFDGSAVSLAVQAIGGRPASRDEIDRLKKLVADLEKQNRKKSR
jgi:predicted transcriptional regulator